MYRRIAGNSLRKRPCRGLTRDNGTASRVTMNTSNGSDRRHCNSDCRRGLALPIRSRVGTASRSLTSSLTDGLGNSTP
ncbi:hypothetical protein D3C78_1877930 [compost metagenome]